jgi:hypothetical protein
MERYIRAIKDNHSHPAGRLLAKQWLNSGVINVFFMEWAVPIKHPLDACFQNLNAGDAEPSLRELASICLSKRIDVVHCDLTPEVTVQRLNSANDGYGPYFPSSVFQPWGQAIRDRNAADVVGDYMHKNPNMWDHALLMYGSDHFRDSDGRNAPGLHMLIELKFANGNIKFLN